MAKIEGFTAIGHLFPRGSGLFGGWPGLEDGDLFAVNGVDPVTDYRQILTEVFQRRIGVADTSTIFPGFSATPLGFADA